MASRKRLYDVTAILKGLSITFGFMFRRRPTIEYPSRKKQHAPRFHGLHELRRYGDGKERCIGCELCSSVCPANAITVIGAENSPEDRRSPGERYAARYEIDELRCIFCGMCEEACPTDAIVLTPRFEMADYRRGSFIYDKDRLLVPAEAGVGTPPDERPGGIPGDLGRVAEIKSTTDVERGYQATWRGEVLLKQREGLSLVKAPSTSSRQARRDSVLPFDSVRYAHFARDDKRVIEFWILAVILVASAVWTIAASKPVYSVVALLLNFAALAVLYVTLSAEFLAVIQIIVYSGAILVLFVFVIALLSSGVSPFAAGPNRLPRIWLPAGIVGLAALGFLIFALSKAATIALRPTGPVGEANVFGSIADFGKALFTVQLLPFEATALILMVAVIGVITLGGEQMTDTASLAHEAKVDRSMREAILREGKG